MVDQAAIAVRPLIEIPHSLDAQVRQVVPEFLQILLAQYFNLVAIGTPGP